MKKIKVIKVDGNLVLGSTIVITAVLEYDTTDSDTVKISIEDPNDTLKINEASMTKLSSTVYQYLYQSSITNDDDGVWTATIKASSGSSIIYDSKTFEVAENPLEF